MSIDVDTATVEQLWPLLAEKLPGLRSSCDRYLIPHNGLCPECHGTGTVPIAPSMERLLEELAKTEWSDGDGRTPELYLFRRYGKKRLLWVSGIGPAANHVEAQAYTPMLALCRAAAKALEVSE